MKQCSKIFVEMDVHKEFIDITRAEQGGEVRRFGEVGGDRGALLKAVRKLSSREGELVFVYEAGPCGFWIQREITALGHGLLGAVKYAGRKNEIKNRLQGKINPAIYAGLTGKSS